MVGIESYIDTEKWHQSLFPSCQSPSASPPPLHFHLFSLVDISDFNGNNINDNLSPLGLQWPAKTHKEEKTQHKHKSGRHRYEDTHGKHQIKTWMKSLISFRYSRMNVQSHIHKCVLNHLFQPDECFLFMRSVFLTFHQHVKLSKT